MTSQNQPKNDAPVQPEPTPQSAPTTPPDSAVTTPPTSGPEPKVEVKDGNILVDGKKYVKESDLIAAKESLQGQLETAQQTHNEAVDKLNTQVSEAQQEVAKATAALEDAKKAQGEGATSEEEVARLKTEAETAKTSLETANTASLDYRRKYIMVAYNIAPDSETGQKLLEKDMSQLESFEEALKALATSRGGPGNYVVGGGTGGAGPVSEMDRAKGILAATPVRGTRNEPSNKEQ